MISGPLLFARFAFPPNLLGYCGPDDAGAVHGYAEAGVADPGLVQLAGQFAGAWPYLQLIAGAAGIDDPLDVRVVGAYWIGGPLLERVGPQLMAAHLEERFRHRLGRHWTDLADLAVAGARPHHNFHVFGVYPWVGLLRAGFSEQPLKVLDRCRVRWGRVASVVEGAVTVRSRPLTWDGQDLSLGPEQTEQAFVDAGMRVRPGDWVALHWDWVCHRLDGRRLGALRRYTASQLGVVNAAPRRPAALAG